MTVQELNEIMSQRFEALEKHIAQRFDAQEQQFNARFDAQEQRQDRLEARMDRIEDKLDKVLELVAIQHGQRAFAVRFWKHAAWITPTAIALVALIRSFL